MFQRIEKESFFKSFSIFFISQALLVAVLSYMEYQKEIKQYEEQLFNTMRVCSFDLKCQGLLIDFVPKTPKYEPYKLYKTTQELSSYFVIPSSKNYLKVYISKQKYLQRMKQIRNSIVWKFLLELLVIALVSFGFTLYTLAPYRSALRLTQEFIKDILHDFNTPLSTLRLNIAMLQKDCPNNKKLSRIQNTIATILRLQENLRSYLYEHTLQKESFSLQKLLQERIKEIEAGYMHIDFTLDVDPSLKLFTHKQSFVRIVDNLLTNAAKYNRKNGSIWVFLEKDHLIIADNGQGIENPKKVFQRYYKEQERGIGIGLHIVKKLCDSLGIGIDLESTKGKGSRFILDLKNIIFSD